MGCFYRFCALILGAMVFFIGVAGCAFFLRNASKGGSGFGADFGTDLGADFGTGEGAAFSKNSEAGGALSKNSGAGCGSFSEWLPQGAVIAIDAGHGGIDGGVTGKTTGVKESDLNLSVAQKLQALFSAAGFSVVMTRTNSGGLYGTTEKGFKRRDLQARKAIVLAAAPTMLLSVHMNYYPPGGRTGAQVFYQKGSSLGRELAKAVQTELNRLGKRAYSALCGDYFLLRENSLPACIIECGFLSDAEEEKRLVDAEYQSQLAYAVFKGCISYLFFTA